MFDPAGVRPRAKDGSGDCGGETPVELALWAGCGRVGGLLVLVLVLGLLLVGCDASGARAAALAWLPTATPTAERGCKTPPEDGYYVD